MLLLFSHAQTYFYSSSVAIWTIYPSSIHWSQHSWTRFLTQIFSVSLQLRSSSKSMDAKFEGLEEKLRSLLSQLQAEHAVFERIVYKNKNQHRRCSYFQHLLKVRRDLGLLQTANLVEILDSCFHVITGKRPKQKVYFLESLKRQKSESGKPNFLERLLGAVRLLSQITEPILKAACEISTLLARGFFMGFSMMVLALLARLRVLVQQILLDFVSIFNTVSSISQKKQSVKIAQDGVEVYREFYPKSEEYVSLECIWKTDKFVLLERMHKSEATAKERDVVENFHTRNISVRYRTVESFLGGKNLDEDKTDLNEADVDIVAKEASTSAMDDTTHLFEIASKVGNQKQIEGCVRTEDNVLGSSASPDKDLSREAGSTSMSSPTKNLESMKPNSGSRKVAFVSVKRLAPSTSDAVEPPLKKTAIGDENNGEDRFYNLLIGGSLNDTLF